MTENKPQPTRYEVINHCENPIEFGRLPREAFEFQYQDDGRTLKVFLKDTQPTQNNADSELLHDIDRVLQFIDTAHKMSGQIPAVELKCKEVLVRCKQALSAPISSIEPSEELEEKVARALSLNFNGTEDLWEDMLSDAKAAIACIHANMKE